MIKATLPKTEAEKFLECALLKVMRVCVEQQMPLEEILNALERVRHTLTEIKLELDVDENQGRR